MRGLGLFKVFGHPMGQP